MWKHHAAALVLLAAISLGTVIGVEETFAGMLGTRALGYGSLFLLGAALSIGPLVRLQPRLFSRLLPFRRAIGIWSALAGAGHFLFVLEYLGNHPMYSNRSLLTLFLAERYVLQAGQTAQFETVHFVLIQENLTALLWVGAVALAILLIVALVSNDWMQRFLGQSAWKLIQQQTYTAFVFVALHVLIMRFGTKLKGSPGLLPWAAWLLAAIWLLQLAGFLVTVWKQRSRKST